MINYTPIWLTYLMSSCKQRAGETEQISVYQGKAR